ncbi:hypothetical protein Q4485_16515 [Granulosicoccaceae sp. 1_MG-2023]|nr:hypothetical protein [Granulosicoccaceae sp. 1_MG-2023]
MSRPVALQLDFLSDELAARIAYFVLREGRSHYALGEGHNPAAVLVLDCDAPESKAITSRALAQGRVVLLLSSVLRTVKGAVVVGKPLSAQKLIRAAKPLQLLLSPPALRPTAGAGIPLLKAHKPVADTAAKRASRHIKLHNYVPVRPAALATGRAAGEDQRWQLLCGPAGEPGKRPEFRYYRAGDSLADYLKQAVRGCADTLSEAAVLRAAGLHLYIVPASGLVFGNLSMKTRRALQIAVTALSADQVTTDYVATHSPQTIASAIGTQKGIVSQLDSLLWLTALLASQGRLAEGTDPDRPVQLRFQPDMTRLESFPHAGALATRWQQEALSLRDMLADAAIPARFIIAFYNAAQSISAFGQEPPALAVLHETLAPVDPQA